MVRFKNRYLLCMFETEYGTDVQKSSVQAREVLAAVRSSLAVNFGDLAVGQAMASLAMKVWSPALGLCVIRSSRDQFRTVWAATSLLTGSPGLKKFGHVRLTVVHVGGTIRSCQKSAAQYARGVILEKTRTEEDTRNIEAAAAGMRRQLDAIDI